MIWLPILLSLLLVLALNWRQFSSLSTGAILRMALIWAVVFVALYLLLHLFGFA